MTEKNKKSIVLVSGGMDSCVTIAIAHKKHNDISFLHVNYGQRTEKRELKAFNEIADFYRVKERLILDFTHLSEIGWSCLTDKNIKVPKADLDNDQIPISYVPFRNANILSAAVSWAEVIDASAIYIGAVEEDSSGGLLGGWTDFFSSTLALPAFLLIAFRNLSKKPTNPIKIGICTSPPAKTCVSE